jgi:predicted dehydrogenase
MPAEHNTERPIRVALLGTGFIADFHLRALKSIPFIETVAVCDTNLARAQSVARRWQIANAHGSVEELLSASRPDVVHILLPPELHAGAAVACLTAGSHVLLEKPMALSSAECTQIEAAASATGTVAGVNHNQQWHPAFLKAVEQIRLWRLGRIEHVATFLSAPLRQLSAGQHEHWMFRHPGNIILEQAPHPLSQITRLLGAVDSASCVPSGHQILSTGSVFFDTWQISLSCERGPAQMLLAFGRDHLEFSIQIIGQDATALVDLRRNTIQFHEKSRFVEPFAYWLEGLRNAGSVALQSTSNLMNYGLAFLKLRAPSDTFSSGMNTSIRNFYEALRTGTRLPVGLREGAMVVNACERIVSGTLASLQPQRPSEQQRAG